MRTIAVAVVALAAAALALSACGDDEELSPEGDAATAVALYFTQERDGGRLPEGTEVYVSGVDTNSVVELDAGETDARFCMEFVYEPGRTGSSTTVRRVYVASLSSDLWSINVENENGTCEGVT